MRCFLPEPYRVSRCKRLGLFVLLGLAINSALNAGPIYSVVNLGSLGSGGASVSSINSSGAAVGYFTNYQGNATPVLFDGKATALPGIGQANGINAAGTVLGTTYINGSPNVTEWSNGQASNLGIAGYGLSLNDAGSIAGAYQTHDGYLRAFTWLDGNLTDLGTLGGSWSSAYAINFAGQVAGTSATAAGTYAAFFSNGVGLMNLGTLGGASSHGLALNNTGEVVGNSQNATGYLNAFAWTSDRGMLNLGTLGGSQSSAYGVNDFGDVVGYSLTAGNADSHGFLYSSGVLMDLNDLLPIGSGWTIDNAFGINNAGEIVGTGTLNGHNYAVELRPEEDLQESSVVNGPLLTPEPAALLLAGAGLIVIGRLRWKRPKG